MHAMQHSWRVVLAALWFAIAAGGVTGCSNAISPTAPVPPVVAPPPAETPAPNPPPPVVVTLAGRVTETAPTASVEVHPAQVTIVDGPDAGRTATTEPNGNYRIEGIHPGTFTIKASADGFVSVTRAVTVGGNVASVDLQLSRVFELLRYTIRGDLAPADGTCSNGVAQKPCRIVAFPVHNPGPVEAMLDWTADAGVTLQMNLFKTATQTLVASQFEENEGPGIHLRGQVDGSAVYELHITYEGGTKDIEYTLTLSYPN